MISKETLKVNGNEDTIDLVKLFQLVMRKIWICIIAAVLAGGAAYSISRFVMSPEYQSYTSLYVKNASSTVSDNDAAVNINDINASKSLVNTYIAILSDDAVMEQVGERLVSTCGREVLWDVLDFDAITGRIKIGSLKSAVTLSAVNQTEVLKVTAITTDPEVSAAICNTVAEIAPEILIRVVGAGSVEAIGSARVMNVPVSPNKTKNTALGALAGFLFAVMIIVIADLLDNTVKASKELTDKYDKAIIGEIQEFGVSKKEARKAKRTTDVKRSTLIDKDTPFNIVESYKAMRTNIVFSLSTTDKKSFLVSSSNPGEGKSTTSVNIAIALAQADHKVLLIDADMRKPVQHKVFSKKNHAGLSSVIAGQKKATECIHKDVIPNLDLLSSGPKPPNPSELLASDKCAAMIAEFQDKYDYVVIDTPPVNVVSDAMGLSKSVAGMILVSRYGVTTFDAAEDAMQKLELADMHLLGFVLNGISAKEAGAYSNYKYKYRSYGKKYGYGYGKYGYSSYGYGYGEEPEEKDDDSSSDSSAEQKNSSRDTSSAKKGGKK